MIKKIFWLLLIILIAFLIRFYAFVPNDGLSDSNLITIDALITSSTIAFAAFMNFSANGSGSSIITRKLNWSNFDISPTSSKTFKTINIFMFPFTNNMAFLISFSVSFSMLIPIAALISFRFLMSYLFVSVLFSGMILLGILYRYILFNSEPYKYSAEILIKKADKIVISNNNDKIKSFGRTYLNVLRSTKNITILNEIAKKMNKNIHDNKYDLLMRKFESIIINNDIKEHDRIKIYFSLFYHNITKGEIEDAKIIEETCTSFLDFLSIPAQDYKKKYGLEASYIVKKIIEEHKNNMKNN